MLVRCLYASRMSGETGAAALESILEQSHRNNVQRGITGILCFTGEIFVQVLEGSRDDVCDLFNAIVRDERHRDVRLLAYEEITVRRFGNWAMGQVNLKTVNPALLLKYSERAELDPFRGSGQATMALLDDLLAAGCIIGRA